MTSWDLVRNVLCANYNQSVNGFCETPKPQEGDGTATYDFGNTVKDIMDLPKHLSTASEEVENFKPQVQVPI